MEEVAQGNSKQPRMGSAEKLNASIPLGSKKRPVSLARWLLGSDSLPQGYLDNHAAVACISQQIVFWMEGNSGRSLGWPGRGRQGYSSLGVLEGRTSEAENCHSSKIV